MRTSPNCEAPGEQDENQPQDPSTPSHRKGGQTVRKHQELTQNMYPLSNQTVHEKRTTYVNNLSMYCTPSSIDNCRCFDWERSVVSRCQIERPKLSSKLHHPARVLRRTTQRGLRGSPEPFDERDHSRTRMRKTTSKRLTRVINTSWRARRGR